MTHTVLDATDKKILSILQQDGRISNLELAERVGLSPTPCSRRVKNLEETGVIVGYHARINPVSLGHSVSVMVSLRLARQTPADIQNFLAVIEQLPEVTECLLVTGSADYLLRVRSANVESLRDFVLTRLKSIPAVSETTTMLILETVKSLE